jgi:TPR repeat protein
MRILFAALVLLVTASLAHGQETKTSACELQQLAINAALGDATAQHDLGVEFFLGQRVPQDYSKAATMWRLASDAGIVKATHNLGYLTYYGKGVRQDYAEGVRLWRIAAEKGFAEAQIHIGQAYYDGTYLKRDMVEAYAWATAGRHSIQAKPEQNSPQVAKKILGMAEGLLNITRKRLTNAQMSEAEKKAAEYIAKFRP